MRDLNEICTQVNDNIDRYRIQKLSLISDQSDMLRNMSCCYADLADHRVHEHETWESYYMNSKATSNAAKKTESDIKVPQLYMIRKTMEKTKIIIEALRSTISAAKQQ